jgi:NAD(P)-dependent dehydrogenase (short-subunit alcohol dehydrogenase family)
MTGTIFPDLKGKSVYITGGASGIGAALTDGFMAQGAKVAIIGRSAADAFIAEMEVKHGATPCLCRAISPTWRVCAKPFSRP